jgi:hypothetical protein
MDLQKFHPDNLINLTKDEVTELCDCSEADLKALAEEYNNGRQDIKASRLGSYLVATEIPIGVVTAHIPFSTTYENLLWLINSQKGNEMVNGSIVSTYQKKYAILGVVGGVTLQRHNYVAPANIVAPAIAPKAEIVSVPIEPIVAIYNKETDTSKVVENEVSENVPEKRNYNKKSK